MEILYLKTEARFFCVLILAFLFIFRRRNFKYQSRENNFLHLFLFVNILFSVLADLTQNEILQGICFSVCGISCFVGAYFCCEQFVNIRELKITKLVKSVYIFGCVAFGLLSLILLNSGISAPIFLLAFAAVVLLVVEQNNKIKIDNLTKLYNRYGMDVELKEQLRQYRLEHEDSFYIIACDLDNFKHINDTWGHPEGDRALTLVAGVLTRVGKKFDSAVFRIGGDEFIIITDKSPQ
jgi:GGDEF domain-containing protein